MGVVCGVVSESGEWSKCDESGRGTDCFVD